MSGNYSLLEAFPFGAPDVSVKVGAGKKMGTGGQGVPPVEVKVAGQDPMAAGRRRRHTKKGGQPADMAAGRRRRHTKRGGQPADMAAGRRRKHTKKGGQDAPTAGRRHRSRKH